MNNIQQVLKDKLENGSNVIFITKDFKASVNEFTSFLDFLDGEEYKVYGATLILYKNGFVKFLSEIFCKDLPVPDVTAIHIQEGLVLSDMVMEKLLGDYPDAEYF